MRHTVGKTIISSGKCHQFNRSEDINCLQEGTKFIETHVNVFNGILAPRGKVRENIKVGFTTVYSYAEELGEGATDNKPQSNSEPFYAF